MYFVQYIQTIWVNQYISVWLKCNLLNSKPASIQKHLIAGNFNLYSVQYCILGSHFVRFWTHAVSQPASQPERGMGVRIHNSNEISQWEYPGPLSDSDIGVGFHAPEYIWCTSAKRRTMSTRRAHTMVAKAWGTPSTCGVWVNFNQWMNHAVLTRSLIRSEIILPRSIQSNSNMEI